MASPQLTPGTINKAMRDEEIPPNPVLQILGLKKIAAQGGQDRYRLHISDGEFSHSFAMLATQLNHLVTDKEIETFTVIRVDKMVCNMMNNKRIMIILGLDVVSPGRSIQRKLGDPMAWAEGAVPPTSKPTPAPPVADSPARTNGVNGGSNYGSRSNSTSGNNTGRPNNTPTTPNRSGPVPSDLANNVIPIRDINPYASKVTIRGRVVNKGAIKNWSNSRGEGKLFSMELLDESADIRMTGFNNSVDAYYDMIEVNHVYYIQNFQVKQANKAFTTCAHDYELTFGNQTVVYPCMEEANDVPQMSFNFVSISGIENIEADKIVDVLGVCKSFEECKTLTARMTGKELIKRDLILVDKSCKEISLTLWGKTAEEFSDDSQPVVAVKGAKVSDFGGKSLSLLQASMFQINPDLPEAHALRGWFDQEGNQIQSQSLSGLGRGRGGAAPFKLCAEANEVSSGDMESSDIFMAKVALMSIKRDNAVYKACTVDRCMKKVTDLGNGLFRCEKCNKEIDKTRPMLMLQCNFADFSDNIWGTAFREQAEIILGQSCENLGEMYDNQPESFDQVIKDALFQQFIVKFRGRMENFNNETRKKFSIMDLNKINYAEYGKQLVAEIQENSN